MKNYILILGLLLSSLIVVAQNPGHFSGGFETNANIFIRDSLIGADNIPQYDRQLYGSEGWFNLNYHQQDLNVGVRFDYFNNSNLLNPNDSYTDQGLGRFYAKKQIGKLEVYAGHIYDQIGSGIIYRAYEQRPLLIDNALLGARISYAINDNWSAKAFTGRQKNRFDTYGSILKGASIEGFKKLSDEKSLTISPGLGYVNRTLDDESMDRVVDILATYQESDRVKPEYNTHALSFFNTMSFDNKWTWYLETAYKTPEAFVHPDSMRQTLIGPQPGKIVKESGSVIYSSLSYAANGLGITVEGKRTENFNFRTDPTLSLNNGLINYIPPMNRENTYRLTSRYSPATQDLSEQAFQVDVNYSPSRKINFNANYSNITKLSGEQLYEEIYLSGLYKKGRTWQVLGGVQLQTYNQEVYEVKPEVPLVKTITPFVDFLYKFDRKKSLRLESQYMSTDEDFGSWAFLLAEFGLAPHWIFEASGMYNVSPSSKAPKDPDTGEAKKNLFPTLGVVYINKSNRLGVRYVKQVEGVVCTGGICRLEPAFSGIKMTVSSTF